MIFQARREEDEKKHNTISLAECSTKQKNLLTENCRSWNKQTDRIKTSNRNEIST